MLAFDRPRAAALAAALAVLAPRLARGDGPLPRYGAVRVSVPPAIDGVLDDLPWEQTPKEGRFFSMRSKPYGQPTREPTSVQIAYDDENLYVAFRCGYSAPGPRDDSMPADEGSLYDFAERVGVLVDARDDRTNARSFTVGRTGARGDSEIANNGGVANRDWRGLWDAATHIAPDGWTAEIKIPWGTLGMPAREGRFQVGINFLRVEPSSNEYSAWAPAPPAMLIAPSFFGYLDGLEQVRPAQRLFLQPYLATLGRADTAGQLPALRDMTGTNGALALYGGAYARYRPPGAFQADATFNPDFSAVTPDRAVTNLDRFELSYPEVRPFFAEDRPRFEMGIPTAQLFYSRRVGLRANASGSYDEVPVLYGAKAVVREGGTQLAAMNVGLTGSTRASLADEITVVRLNESFEHGRRLGNLVLARQGDGGRYLATGMDGAYTMFDEHLTIAGIYARSATDGKGSGGFGEADIGWATEDYQAKVQYLDITDGFDAQLGFVPLTGIRSTVVSAAYTPVLSNDRVRQVVLGAQLDRTFTQSESSVYDRGTFEATANMLDGAIFTVKALPSVEHVAQPFGLAANRIAVDAGRYDVLVLQAQASTPPRRTIEATLAYTEGDLFAGYRRNPSLQLTLNRGRFAGTAQYQIYFLRYGDARLTGHQLSVRTVYSFTPLARTTAVLEWNTLTLHGVAQLVTSYQFGALSTVGLVLGGTSGATALNPVAISWYDRPDFRVTASFALGVTPF